MEQNVRRNGQGLKVRDFSAGLLIGGLMGAGLALLEAPLSGMQTRRQIRRRAIALQNKTEQAVEELADLVSDRATGLQANGSAALKDAQKHLDRAVEEAKKSAEAVAKV